MALPPEIAAQLAAYAKQARQIAGRDSRLFLQLGEIVSTVHQTLEEAGELPAFSAWCRESRLARSEAYKALSAWRRLGDAPGAQNQPRTVLELLGGSEKAAEEARPLLSRRLTIREARAIVARHKAPRPKTPRPPIKARTFRSTLGPVILGFEATDQQAIQALAQVIQALQAGVAPGANAPPAPATGRGLLDRLSGRAA
jgi:hypothetical protein